MVISFVKDTNRLLLEYAPRNDLSFVFTALKERKEVTIRRTFTFGMRDLVAPKNFSKLDADDSISFVFGVADGDYYRVNRRILGLKHDLLLWKETPLSHKTFIAETNISIFHRIDALMDEPIVVGGKAVGAIPQEVFEELLANFPTTTELRRYAESRVSRVLKDHLGTKSDAQEKLNAYLNKNKSIRARSPIDFLKDYEPKKFEYVRDEIQAMLMDADAFIEKDWQRRIVAFLLILFPRYVALLENVRIRDSSSSPGKIRWRFIDLMLVDANGTVDIIEVKRPQPHQLLSRKPRSRGNYTPSVDLSEAVMQVEKYLFHLSRWGQAGERAIQEKYKAELPKDLGISIANPKALLILGRDKDFNDKEKFDFEIIKRKYANIADIMTYDDLLRRLDNIITMLSRNLPKSEMPSKKSEMQQRIQELI